MFIKPDYNIGKIYEIPIDELKSSGINAVLLDLDSTVMISKKGEYLKETLEWFDMMQQHFKLAIVTNNKNQKYIKKVESCTPFLVISDAKKPKTKGIKDAMKILDVKEDETVMVGDRPLTDILAGKFAKTKTILVKSINYENENHLTHFVRWLERLSVRHK